MITCKNGSMEPVTRNAKKVGRTAVGETFCVWPLNTILRSICYRSTPVRAFIFGFYLWYRKEFDGHLRRVCIRRCKISIKCKVMPREGDHDTRIHRAHLHMPIAVLERIVFACITHSKLFDHEAWGHCAGQILRTSQVVQNA